MKELRDIIRSYDTAVAKGRRTALATVVHVDGSSYRRPGARMLVTEDGNLTGAISGGCLEGDALRKALLAIQQQRNKLVTYDTTDDDSTLGVQLGCNGIVHILFEPLDSAGPNAVDLLKAVAAKRREAALATIFSLESDAVQPGTIIAATADGLLAGTRADQGVFSTEKLTYECIEALSTGTSTIKQVEGARGNFSGFIQVIPPAVSLIIFGAGNDAIPLADLAHRTGWSITVVDGRQSHATLSRFPFADTILVSKAEQVGNGITIDALTAAVLMTHNYNYDLKVLERLLSTSCSYIGILGPKTKLNKMLDELADKGVEVNASDEQRIYGPIGLDIGAETAEEIALSIAAEIKGVFAGAHPASLRDKRGPIHKRSAIPVPIENAND